MEEWKHFLTETTIHGFLYLSKKAKRTKVIWTCIITVSFALCTWQSAINVRDYFRYNIATATTYEPLEEIPFPAITLYNSNAVRRTILGQRVDAMQLLAYMFSLNFTKINKTFYYRRNGTDEVLKELFYKTEKLLVTTWADEKNTDRHNILMNLAFKYLMITRDMTFIKCWIQKRLVDCSAVILKTIKLLEGFTVPSFSLNLDSAVMELFQDFDVLKIDKFNQSEIMTNWKSGAGIDSGYRFLLNVHREEYCYNQPTNFYWYGAGLHVTFHDSNSYQITPDLPGDVFLSPGYSYDVVLKAVKYTRKTEHIGKCLTKFPTTPLLPVSKYVKSICQLQCQFDSIWNKCRCTRFMVKSVLQKFARRKGLNVSDIASCYVNSTFLSCYHEYFDPQIYSFDSDCRQCLPPCDEIVYNYDITATKFPPSNFFLTYELNETLQDDGSWNENYLMMNLFFGSKFCNVIIDTQMISFVDLSVFIGSNAGLFFGMSFVSFHDVTHFTMMTIQRRIKKLYKQIKVKKVVKKFRSIKKKNRIHPTRHIIVYPMQRTTAL